MSINPANRRLAVAGPSSEVRWLVERARGRLDAPLRAKSAWRPRSELSFRALADLLPFELRPPQIPEEIEDVSLQDIWVSRDGMSQAHWGLTDYVWPDDKLLGQLLAALSARYRNLSFIMASEDPDTFEAESALIWQGRVQRRRARLLEVRRIRKMIYLRHGLSRTATTKTSPPLTMIWISRCWTMFNASGTGSSKAPARFIQAPLTRGGC
jgi:hypothetical protein